MKNPFSFLRRKTAAPNRGSSLFHAIRARFAAATSAAPERGVSYTEALVDDNVANPETRRRLRVLSRYEFCHNAYARGIAQSLANDSVSYGPRLRFAADNDDLAAAIERDFAVWSEAVHLAVKLRALRVARCVDGEAFVFLARNPALTSSIKLDPQVIEADRITGGEQYAAFSSAANSGEVTLDGIKYDRYGNPKEYRVLIGGIDAAENAANVSAANMIHVYRQDRPEQRRGIPEFSAALPLFAQLRRYTAAVVASAEKCAEFAGVLYTDNPTDGQPAAIEPLDAFDIEYNKLTTMPEGWKMSELYVKPPLATYSDFKRELLSEIGAALGVPYAVAAGTSSGFTYASAKLDHQTYFRNLKNERGFIEDAFLNRLFEVWLKEWRLMHPEYDAGEISAALGQWLWPRLDDVDQFTSSRMTAMELANGTTTLAHEFAKRGKNWKTEILQRQKEAAFLKSLGLSES